MRISENGRLLLLKSTGFVGKLAVCDAPCKILQIAVQTDGFQHPGCIEMELEARGFSEVSNVDSRLYSKCYEITPGPGSFEVKLRWRRTHSPYPQIQDMKIWVFGKAFPSRSYPKAPSTYAHVCDVEIMEDGRVLVDGADMGVWPTVV